MINKLFFSLLLISLIGVANAQWNNFVPYGFPQGDYYSTCSGVMSGTTLMMNCITDNNTSNNTNLENANSCNFVQNINGVLTCTGGWK